MLRERSHRWSRGPRVVRADTFAIAGVVLGADEPDLDVVPSLGTGNGDECIDLFATVHSVGGRTDLKAVRQPAPEQVDRVKEPTRPLLERADPVRPKLPLKSHARTPCRAEAYARCGHLVHSVERRTP
jgi:hypothetical protein